MVNAVLSNFTSLQEFKTLSRTLGELSEVFRKETAT